MSSDLEPVVLKRPIEIEETRNFETSSSPISAVGVLNQSASIAQQPAKKVKKEKDPNAPKRPLNSYFLFQRDHRLLLKSTQPDLPFSEMSRLINEAWDKMSTEDHSKYENEAKTLLEAYNKENKAYKEGKEEKPVIVTESVITEQAPSSTTSAASKGAQTLEIPLPESTSSSSAESPKKKKKKQKHREGSENVSNSSQ